MLKCPWPGRRDGAGRRSISQLWRSDDMAIPRGPRDAVEFDYSRSLFADVMSDRLRTKSHRWNAAQCKASLHCSSIRHKMLCCKTSTWMSYSCGEGKYYFPIVLVHDSDICVLKRKHKEKRRNSLMNAAFVGLSSADLGVYCLGTDRHKTVDTA